MTFFFKTYTCPQKCYSLRHNHRCVILLDNGVVPLRGDGIVIAILFQASIYDFDKAGLQREFTTLQQSMKPSNIILFVTITDE